METLDGNLNPKPPPLHRSSSDDGDRSKKRRSDSDFQASSPEPMVFSAGSSWAAKVDPSTEKDFVFLVGGSEESGMIRLIPSGENRPLPTLEIDPMLMNTINQEWQDAMIIKLTGCAWNVEMLKLRLDRLWDLKGVYELIDIGNNIFILKDVVARKREEILTMGPWQIAGKFMSIRKWFQDFDPDNYKVDTAITWVRIHRLPPQFYREAILHQIASGLGEPIKADAKTFWGMRGKYARLCIQVDLSKPVERGIIINGK